MIPPRHTPDAALRIRARMYRSRHATLRTVRIAGDGSVWVDGLKRRVRIERTERGVDLRTADPIDASLELSVISGVLASMEVVR